MAADYARHYDAAGAVDNFSPAVLLLEDRGSINLNNLTRFNGYGVTFENSTVAVHRNEDPVLYD